MPPIQTVISTPSSTKYKQNYIRDYIYKLGYDYNISCGQLFLSKNIKDILRPLTKFLGDYSYTTITSKGFKDTHQEKYQDFSQPCPDGWTFNPQGKGCFGPLSYKGPCDAGITEYGRDARGRQIVIRSSRPAYLSTKTEGEKEQWASTCGVKWPEKERTIPAGMVCNYAQNTGVYEKYGASVNDNLKNRSIKLLGALKKGQDYLDAAVMLVNAGIDSQYFAIIDNNVYFPGYLDPQYGSGDPNFFTSKGKYDPECSKSNPKVQLYQVNTKELYDKLIFCKNMNDKINTLNEKYVPDLYYSQFDIYKQVVDKNVKNNPKWQDEYKKTMFNDSTLKIQNNLNEILKNLSGNFNMKAKVYNKQADLINRHQELVEDNSKKLNNQLDTLDKLEDEIALKTRIVELNEVMAKKQQVNKKLLIGFFVLLPLLVIPAVLAIFKVISPGIAIAIGVLFILGYIIFALLVRRAGGYDEFKKPIMRQMSKYERAIQKFYDKEKAKIDQAVTEFIEGKCECPAEYELVEEDITGGKFKGNFMMQANGPFYYDDGSALPQQIYPHPEGSINFEVDDKVMTWPKEIQAKLDTIGNPLQRMFFTLWLQILKKKKISVDDPRFSKNLDVTDLETGPNTPLPFWENIKLPMVTDFDRNIGRICQNYNEYRIASGSQPGTFLADTWNYFFQNRIPDNTFQTWITKINTAIDNKQSVDKVYVEFVMFIINSQQFKSKHGSLDSFLNKKIGDFVDVFNSNVQLSEPNTVKTNLVYIKRRIL